MSSFVNLFDGRVWIESVKHATIDAINNIDNADYPCQWYERELITLLAMEMTRKGGISVLDFGGGPATTFASIIGKLPSGNLQYHIVDTPANCELGKSLFPTEARILFSMQVLTMISIFNCLGQNTISSYPAARSSTHITGGCL